MIAAAEAIRTEREDVVLRRNREPENWSAYEVPRSWTNFDIIMGNQTVGTLAVHPRGSSELFGIAYEVDGDEADTDYRGNGLAPLALRGMLKHARDVWQMPGFEITIDPDNLPSVKTAVRGGLDFAGYRPETQRLEFSIHF